MKQRIIIFGDSYTFGHGCHDRIYYYDNTKEEFVGDVDPFYKNIPSEYCWPALLQNKFSNLEVINLAKPGHSNPGMFRDLIEFYEKSSVQESDIVIFSGTFATRIEIPSMDNPEVAKSWCIGWDYMSQKQKEHDAMLPESKKAKELYVKHLFNNAIAYNIAVTSLFAAHNFCKLNNIKYIWSYPEHDYPDNIKKLLSLMHETKSFHICKYDFEKGLYHAQGLQENSELNKSCYAPDYHVNDLGHSIYFEKEILPRIKSLYEQ